MKFINTLLVLLLSTAAFAQDATAPAVEVKNYSGESEASSIVVSGNSNSETYGLKSANTYNVSENDILGLKGRYIRSTSGGSTTAEAWMAALRYERVLSKDLYTGFIQQTAEADPYNGVFIQRDSTDVGFKYFITKTDDLTWFAEFGYRYTSTYTTTPKVNTSNLRAYTEGVYKVNANTTVKAWLELLPNLTTSKNYLINSEISLAVSMSKMFSLKTGLLVNYNNGVNNDKNGDAIAGSNLKNTSTAWTTALVASY